MGKKELFWKGGAIGKRGKQISNISKPVSPSGGTNVMRQAPMSQLQDHWRRHES